MFENTYQPKYYKKLHRYVHKVFRTQQGLENLKLILSGSGRVNKKTIRSILAMFYYVPSAIVDKVQLDKLKTEG